MTDRDLLILAIRTAFFRRTFNLTDLTIECATDPLFNRRWQLVYGTVAPHSLPKMKKAMLVADVRRTSVHGAPERSGNRSPRKNTKHRRSRQSRAEKGQKLAEALANIM